MISGWNHQVEWCSQIKSNKKVQADGGNDKDGVFKLHKSISASNMLILVDWSLSGRGLVDVRVRTEPRYQFLVFFLFPAFLFMQFLFAGF